VGNSPLRHTKSAATGDSQLKCQNGYRAAEGTSLFHGSKPIVRVQRRFHLEYRNCQSSSKNSIECWYEQFKGNVQRKKGVGRPDEVDERVRESFTS
ncbi:hypothetical protein AVEN_240007-1, partial [Araneus ventricosus]